MGGDASLSQMLGQSTKGWWASHDFKKHSVNEIDEFIGWGKLQAIAEAATNFRNKALPLVLFHTGTRVSEGLQLRKGHFDLSDPAWVRCVDVPIVKQKVSKPFRTFSFPRDEPTWHFVEEYLGILDENAPLFKFDRTQSYNIITHLGESVGLTIWNHWFRSQRASQMGAEYELTENDLMEWFKVKDRNWARRYCKKGDWGLRKVLAANKPATWKS